MFYMQILIHIFQNHLFFDNLLINIYLIKIDLIYMNIFKKCPYIDYRYVLSIYGPPLPEEDDGQAEGAQAS